MFVSLTVADRREEENIQAPSGRQIFLLAVALLEQQALGAMTAAGANARKIEIIAISYSWRVLMQLVERHILEVVS